MVTPGTGWSSLSLIVPSITPFCRCAKRKEEKNKTPRVTLQGLIIIESLSLYLIAATNSELSPIPGTVHTECDIRWGKLCLKPHACWLTRADDSQILDTVNRQVALLPASATTERSLQPRQSIFLKGQS